MKPNEETNTSNDQSIQVAGEPMAPVDLRYVDIMGRAAIEFAPDENAIKLTFLGGDMKPMPDLKSIFFYGNGSDKSVKFKHVLLTAEFNEQGFRGHEATLRTIDPLLKKWEELEQSDGSVDMNPSGPPKSRG